MTSRKDGRKKMSNNKKTDEIDKLFGFNEEELLNTAKRKSISKMASISIGMSLLIFILLAALKLQVTPILLDKKASEISYYYGTHGANIFVGGFSGDTKLTRSEVYSTKYKVVDGIPVVMGEVAVPSEKYEHNFYMSNGDIFSSQGHRVMQFFHPSINYKNYRDDLEKLDELEVNNVVELGVSFDKKYSFKEIKEMLPEGIQLNWCWVDGIDEAAFGADNEVFDSSYAVFEEDNVLGFSTIQGNGESKEDPVADFIESLELIIPKTKKHKEELVEVVNKLSNGKGTINPGEVPIIGAVVVGKAEELKALRGIPKIKASSFGIILK